MMNYFLTVTSDLLLDMFNNEWYSIFVITFLFATGLTIFKMLKSAV